MTAARAVVLPSAWEETFGLVAVEAMSLGVAAIAAAHGAFPELITDEVDGVLFRPGDPAALAEVLGLADKNEELFEEYGVRPGRPTSSVSPRRQHAGMLDIYRYAIENPVTRFFG